MGHDCVREVDAKVSVEQMGDYIRTGPASQNTYHIHMDLPY
jgi:hypothetical protein